MMWPDAGNTQELIVSARDGDADAMNALLERHRAAMRRLVALRMDRAVQGRVDASDIVQEALVEANRRMSDYLRNPVMPFHLWLRKIASDRLIDAHRRHHLAARRSVDRERATSESMYADRSAMDLAEQLCDHRELTPAAAVLKQELTRRLRDAIERLDPNDREMIEARHVECLTNQEIAQALGMSEPAAGMRYLRAMRRLRAMLDELPSATIER
jgi:RNA polymerase sigma-70 factor (ECF subfamily)